MKRWLTAALLLASSLAWGAVDEGRYFDISDFHCGVDTYHSSLAINDCYVQDALNVYFDKDAPIVKRSGYTTFASSSSYAFIGLWSYTDLSSNIWMIARSSDAIMATTEVGTSLFTVRIATVSSSNIVNSVNAFGNAYFVDQTQGVYYWNGTSTTYVSGSPKGSLIAQFHNRIWVSGLASPNGNYVQGSKYLDGTVWATGINASDPILLQVALNDSFDVVTALWAGYNDIMYIFKNYSIHGLYGFDQTDFQVRALNGEVGCIDQRSIQFFLGGLVFASARGIESFDGYTATRISDPIKTKVDPITLNSSFNQNSWTQSSQADWQTGTINPTASLSTPISEQSLILSTFSHTDSVSSDWPLGTLNALTASGNSLILAISNSNISNNGFESGSSNWTLDTGVIQTGSLSGVNCTLSPRNGSKLLRDDKVNESAGDTYKASLQTCAGSEINNVTWIEVDNSCSWTSRTLSSSGATRRSVKIVLTNTTTASTVATSDCFLNSGTNITFFTASDYTRAAVPIIRSMAFEDFTDGNSTISSGTYTSPSFNHGIQNTTVLSSVSWTVNTATPSFVLQGSNDGSNWSDITTSTGVNIASTKKYLRYLSTFTWTTAVDINSSLNSVSLVVSASSGTWASQSHNISTATAFGNFNANSTTTGGANIVYNVCSSASSTMANKTCVITPANSNISVSTNIYVQVLTTFTITAATETASIQDFTLNWYTGTRKPSVASAVYDNRYWLSVTTDTADSYNDATLVLSAGPLWSIFDIRAGSFVIWKNAFYFGNSFSSGYVYQLEQGSNDNGAAINAYIKTKDYAPGGLTSDKFFGKIHLVADNLGAYNIYTNYYIDRTTTSFSLGNIVQNETPGTLITKLQIPVDSTHQNFGKTISFKFQQNDVSAPWKFYGATLRYKSRRPR